MATVSSASFVAPLAVHPDRGARLRGQHISHTARRPPLRQGARMTVVDDPLWKSIKSGALPVVEKLPCRFQDVLVAVKAAATAAGELTAMVEKGATPESRKWIKLVLCLGIDLVGSSSLPVPFLTDVLDIAWAPFAAMAIYALFEQRLFSAVGFVEEILPGTDGLPTASLAWIMEHYGHAIRTEWAVVRIPVVDAKEVVVEDMAYEHAVQRCNGIVHSPEFVEYLHGDSLKNTVYKDKRWSAISDGFLYARTSQPLQPRPCLTAASQTVTEPSPSINLTTAAVQTQSTQPLMRVRGWYWNQVTVVRDLNRLATAANSGALLVPGPVGALARAEVLAVYTEIMANNWARHDAAMSKLFGSRVLQARRFAFGALSSRRRADVRRREELRDAISALVVFNGSDSAGKGRKRRAKGLPGVAGRTAEQFTAALFAFVGAIFTVRETLASTPQTQVALAVSENAVDVSNVDAAKQQH